ncbi:MAG: EamA family transporter [Burkholderiaceae bacterium]|nr:EamA family transporter [Burkholderiaceae bacterium]
MRSDVFLGIALAASAAIFWGTAGVAQSFIVGNIPPLWVAAFRLCIASLFFVSILYISHRALLRNSLELMSKHVRLILLTGFFIVTFNFGFFFGVKATGIAVGAATMIGSAPIWAGILDIFLNRRIPAPLWWLGTSCATSGGVLMVVAQASTWQIDPFGLTACLLSGLFYAAYTISSSKLVQRMSPLVVTSSTFSVATMMAIPMALIFSGLPSHITTIDCMVVGYLGIVVTGIAYLLFSFALTRISATTGVAMSLIEPVTAFFMAILVAGEPITWLAFLGLCLILVGLHFVLAAEAQMVKK